jgi:hypothetical protein
MRNEAEYHAFQYAKKVGVKLVIAVPNYELLPLVEKKVKEYDFKVLFIFMDPISLFSLMRQMYGSTSKSG